MGLKIQEHLAAYVVKAREKFGPEGKRILEPQSKAKKMFSGDKHQAGQTGKVFASFPFVKIPSHRQQKGIVCYISYSDIPTDRK